jgi:DNA polymerase III epsilon subunit-like protein
MTEFDRIAFIDLEASGLGSNGFPTELGWAVIREDGSVESSCCLIRPPSSWRFYTNAWSNSSERLTGITRQMLEEDGLAPAEAMKRFMEAVGDRELVSDEPDFDNHWLGMVAKAAGISLQGRVIGNANSLIGKAWPQQRPQPEVGRASHRAEPDARRLALACAAALHE